MVLPVDPARYGAFLAVMAVMAATPGPANLFAIATGIQRGPGAALVAMAGMCTATLVWFAAAALGLGALVTAFPGLFRLLAIGGGLYLVWLGVDSILAGLRGEADQADAPTVQRQRSAYIDGFAVQLANPKAMLLFTAVLPPFVDLARPVPPQMLLFAAATVGMDMITMSAYGLGGAALADRMAEPRFRKGFRIAVGVLLITAAGLILSRG